MMASDLERAACRPCPVEPIRFNPKAKLPYGCTTEHVRLAMNDFTEFLGVVNERLHEREIERLESILMPASFSSLVGELMGVRIRKYSRGLVKNRYHNGHPDLVPVGSFPDDAVQHSSEGIEIKASRYHSGWQGHNPESVFVMVFVFDSNRPADATAGVAPRPFAFLRVLGAHLSKNDWLFAGRSPTSRRTITASVTESGHEKMLANWTYDAGASPERER